MILVHILFVVLKILCSDLVYVADKMKYIKDLSSWSVPWPASIKNTRSDE